MTTAPDLEASYRQIEKFIEQRNYPSARKQLEQYAQKYAAYALAKVERDNSCAAQTAEVVSLKEGMVRKGGKNSPPSQAEILARPPAPMRRLPTVDAKELDAITREINQIWLDGELDINYINENAHRIHSAAKAYRANMQGETK
jgi:hypothetical protein